MYSIPTLERTLEQHLRLNLEAGEPYWSRLDLPRFVQTSGQPFEVVQSFMSAVESKLLTRVDPNSNDDEIVGK